MDTPKHVNVDARSIRKQSQQNEFKSALKTGHAGNPIDKYFGDLLARLEEAERNQKK